MQPRNALQSTFTSSNGFFLLRSNLIYRIVRQAFVRQNTNDSEYIKDDIINRTMYSYRLFRYYLNK